MQDKLQKVQEFTASISASVKDKNLIQEVINKHEKEFVRIKNYISDTEADATIQNLTDEKKNEEPSTFLLKREHQLTDLKNQIIDAEKKLLGLKSALQLELEQYAEIEELQLKTSMYEEESARIRKQREETNIILKNNDAITIRNLERSIEVTKKNVEIAKCAMKKVAQKTSKNKKAFEDREALKNILMKLNEELDEKH